jgi:hypothetical protein
MILRKIMKSKRLIQLLSKPRRLLTEEERKELQLYLHESDMEKTNSNFSTQH